MLNQKQKAKVYTTLAFFHFMRSDSGAFIPRNKELGSHPAGKAYRSRFVPQHCRRKVRNKLRFCCQQMQTRCLRKGELRRESPKIYFS
jgi:hypothetical protein